MPTHTHAASHVRRGPCLKPQGRGGGRGGHLLHRTDCAASRHVQGGGSQLRKPEAGGEEQEHCRLCMVHVSRASALNRNLLGKGKAPTWTGKRGDMQGDGAVGGMGERAPGNQRGEGLQSQSQGVGDAQVRQDAHTRRGAGGVAPPGGTARVRHCLATPANEFAEGG